MAYPENDSEFYENVLEKVEDEDDNWAITVRGATTWIPKIEGFEPKAGMNIRIYGRGFGYPVRGVFIDGHQFKYMTIQQADEAHQKWVDNLHKERQEAYEKDKVAIETRFKALPEFFRSRLQGFRDADPKFIWDEEPYEMFCCEQAVVIADALKKSGPEIQSISKEGWGKYYQETITAFMRASSAEQRKLVPGLSDEHSGNTFGGACQLAYRYLLTMVP